MWKHKTHQIVKAILRKREELHSLTSENTTKL